MTGPPKVEKAETRLAASVAVLMAEEGRGDVGGVVDDPAEGEGALFGGENAGEDGGDGGAVLGGGDVEDDVFAAFDVDDLAVVEEGLPGAVLRLVLGGGAAPRVCSM